MYPKSATSRILKIFTQAVLNYDDTCIVTVSPIIMDTLEPQNSQTTANLKPPALQKVCDVADFEIACKSATSCRFD